MRRHALALPLLLALMAPLPAYAAGGGSDAGSDGRIMQADNLVVPVVRDGRLVNYLFVSVRVELNPRGDVFRLKERSHFLRDALIRASHRTSLARTASEVDQAAAVRAFTAAAEEALGAGAVRGVEVELTGSLQRAR